MSNDDLSEDFEVDLDVENELTGRTTEQLLLILISMCKKNNDELNTTKKQIEKTLNTLDKLDKLGQKSTQVENTLEKINTRLDELGFDTIRVGNEITNMSKKIDAVSSLNSDPAELNGKKKNSKQTRSIVTSFWKGLYADNMTFPYKKDIVDDDITGILKEIGITAELINYVRHHKGKDNAHSIKRDYQEHEGWFVWKELQIRIKKADDSKSEVAMIKKRIQSLHTKFKNDRTKEDAKENKIETIVENETSDTEEKNSTEISQSKSTKKKSGNTKTKKTTKSKNLTNLRSAGIKDPLTEISRSKLKQTNSKTKSPSIKHLDKDNDDSDKSYYIDTDDF